jgi:hypothetical protein
MRAATLRAAMRRGWVWPIDAAHAAPEFQADLRELGGLARAGLAADDDDLPLAVLSPALGAASGCVGGGLQAAEGVAAAFAVVVLAMGPESVREGPEEEARDRERAPHGDSRVPPGGVRGPLEGGVHAGAALYPQGPVPAGCIVALDVESSGREVDLGPGRRNAGPRDDGEDGCAGKNSEDHGREQGAESSSSSFAGDAFGI